MKKKVLLLAILLMYLTFSLGFAQNDTIKVIGTSAKLGSSDNVVTIEMANSQPIMGIELTLLYPLGLEVSQINLISRASDMSVEEDNPLGQLTIIIFGFGETILPGDGPIVEVIFDVALNASPGNYALNLNDVLAANTYAEKVTIEPIDGTFVIEDMVIPVELASFRAAYQTPQNIVQLEWQTRSETNNYGFEIQRRAGNDNFTKIGFVEGYGTTSSPSIYGYQDSDLSEDSYQYRLKQIDFDGSFFYSQSIEVEITSPKLYKLGQNYPNPFSISKHGSQTAIRFQLPQTEMVEIKVYDMLGREVRTLVSKVSPAGSHQIHWDGKNKLGLPVSAGMYYYQIKTQNFNACKKILIIE